MRYRYPKNVANKMFYSNLAVFDSHQELQILRRSHRIWKQHRCHRISKKVFGTDSISTGWYRQLWRVSSLNRFQRIFNVKFSIQIWPSSIHTKSSRSYEDHTEFENSIDVIECTKRYLRLTPFRWVYITNYGRFNEHIHEPLTDFNESLT